MDKKTKTNILIVSFGVALFSALNNLGAVWAFCTGVIEVVFPVALGLAFAFLLNIPMRHLEKALFKLTGGRHAVAVSALSLALCAATAAGILFLAGALIVPAVSASLAGAYGKICERLPVWAAVLSERGFDSEWLYGIVSEIDKNKLLSYIAGRAGSIFGSVWGAVLGAVSGAADIGAALVICVYVLLSKRTLKRQVSACSLALLGKRRTDRVLYIGKVVSDVYSRFFSRQCIEACILSAIMYLAMLIFKIPYAALIALLCGLCSFVQYLGGVFACFIGAFLVALSEPPAVIVYLIVYAVVQIVENQFIYPNVVGSSLGLGGVWTVCAAVIGGGVLGVFGMVLAIPLTSAFLTLLKEKISRDQTKENVGRGINAHKKS